jgi:pimeloyl-ACP methyl ester carboxylesterase
MARLWAERNQVADVPSILAMFDALIQGDPPWFAEVQTPVLILTGSEDAAHQRAFALRDVLPDAELVTLDGAGHACQLELPWEFDRHLLDFLERRVGLPDITRPRPDGGH